MRRLSAIVIVCAAGAAFAADVKITSTPPGATVFVDAKYAGVSPLTVTGIAPGEHRLKFVRHGYTTMHKTITVAQEPSSVAVALETNPRGAMRITSVPNGADVYIDGEMVDKTPLSLPNLDVGEYEVRVQAPGFTAVTRRVDVAEGRTVIEHFELKLSRTEQYYLGQIKAEPDNLANYIELAHLHLVSGHIEKGIGVFRDAIRVASKKGVTRESLKPLIREFAKVQRGQFDYGDAEVRRQVRLRLAEIIKEAVESGPENPLTLKELLKLYSANSGTIEDVMAMCDRVLKKAPDSPICRELGSMYLDHGLADDAITLLKRAAKLQPDDFDTQLMLGTAYHRLDRLEQAASTYDAASRLEATKPSKAKLYEMRARLARSAGDLEKAVEAWEAAIELAPARAMLLRMTMAKALIKLNKLDEAEKVCNTILNTDKRAQFEPFRLRVQRMMARIARLREAKEPK